MSRFLDSVRLAAGVKPYRRNLAINPSFATDTSGWQSLNANGTLARSTTWGATVAGSTSGAVTCNVTGDIGIMLTNRLAISGFAAYTVQCRTYTATAGRALYLQTDWYDAANVFISSSVMAAPTTSVANTEQLLTLMVNAPQTATQAQVIAKAAACAVNDVVSFDAFCFEEGSQVLPYFAGGSGSAYRWTGTANASISETVLDLGGVQLSNVGGIDTAGSVITGLPTPSATTDAATKGYVDGLSNATTQIFTSSGTYTKPAGAIAVTVLIIGGGGGGGSGRRGSATTQRGGGGGGAGGIAAYAHLPASVLSAGTSVTVGAGGSGGAAVAVNDTDGNAGGYGGGTQFGSLVVSYGGNGGSGGTTSGGAGGVAQGVYNGSGGGGSNINSSAGSGMFGWGGVCGAGGGAGGGADATNVAYAGGAGGGVWSGNETPPAGGSPGAGANGAAGATGSNSPLNSGIPGQGGGGGGASNLTGGAGGAGVRYGGGGGGGGSGLNGNNSGIGGIGGPGIVIVTTYL